VPNSFWLPRLSSADLMVSGSVEWFFSMASFRS